MGQDAQLDLGVIGREKLPSPARDKGFSDLASLLGADGDILQVRVAAAQPAGCGHGLVERGVDAPGLRVNQLQECIGVGGT